jgi:hypothetical protein
MYADHRKRRLQGSPPCNTPAKSVPARAVPFTDTVLPPTYTEGSSPVETDTLAPLSGGSERRLPSPRRHVKALLPGAQIHGLLVHGYV